MFRDSQAAMPDVKAFDNWYDRASVRSTPRRLVEVDDDIHKAFFPEHLVLHLSHPLIDPEDHKLRRYLTAQHLYQWLQFTTTFEVAVVGRATQLIADNGTGLTLSANSRMTAFQILVDEAYHSLFSLDVQHQLVARSGIGALEHDFGPFIANLDAIGDDMPDHRVLVQLLQVVVFETLITSILNDIPVDESLIGVVRTTVRDHAIDEGRHHVFFATFFKHLWGQLDTRTRALVAGYLPNLIVRSLQPATAPAAAALLSAGFSEQRTKQVIAESYAQDTVVAGIRQSAAKTIRLLEEVGVLDVPGAREQFLTHGLILERR
ncbi:diiron oxygenase [Kitasatospora sp. NPDC093806]|uniref:diiron oxygenase n=1 Tax=Kitasatospora sp. NPDC093806 TaxID=3155075 RepID=UPI00341A5B32